MSTIDPPNDDDCDQAELERRWLTLDATQRRALLGAVAVLRAARPVLTPEAHEGFDAALACGETWAREGVTLDDILAAGELLDGAKEEALLAGPALREYVATVELLRATDAVLSPIGTSGLDALIAKVARWTTTGDIETTIVHLTTIAAAASARLDGTSAHAVSIGGGGQPS